MGWLGVVRAAFLPGAVAALAAAAAAGCGSRPLPPPDAPSLLLITIDTLRADALGVYGAAAGVTPHLDRLAADGVVFDQLISQAPATGPSVASLLTGRYPHEHGVVHSTQVLAGGELTLAEMLAARGYRTAGFISSSILSARYGFAQGFDHWDEELSHPYATGHLERDGVAVTEAALAWLAGQQGAFFLWLHYFDPHLPYLPATPGAEGASAGTRDFLDRLETRGSRRLIDRHLPTIRALYQGEVTRVDRQIGRLVDAVTAAGDGRPTLIAVTADHGEELFDRGSYYGHVQSLSEIVLRVPMILHLPSRLPAGRRVAAVAENVDVVPTLVATLGLSPPEALSGRDLGPAIRGHPDLSRALAQREPYEWMPGGLAFAVREESWKAILYSRDAARLYDLASDPSEQVDLAEREPQRLAQLRAALDRWRRGALDAPPVGRESLDGEARETLRALGYLD